MINQLIINYIILEGFDQSGTLLNRKLIHIIRRGRNLSRISTRHSKSSDTNARPVEGRIKIHRDLSVLFIHCQK